MRFFGVEDVDRKCCLAEVVDDDRQQHDNQRRVAVERVATETVFIINSKRWRRGEVLCCVTAQMNFMSQLFGV